MNVLILVEIVIDYNVIRKGHAMQYYQAIEYVMRGICHARQYYHAVEYVMRGSTTML